MKKTSERSTARRIVRSADRTVDNIVLILLILMLMFGIYSLVDSKLVYMSADASNYEIYRPEGDDSKSFAELQKINPEVQAWLTVIDTEIDYPVCQGEDNEKYVNTSAEGDYSMVGSLFLDHRNRNDFTDFNSIIYGHHMEKHRLFGCFDEYRDKKFFEEHSKANLYYNGKKHGVELFAFIMADAYDDSLYSIYGQDSGEAKAAYLEQIRSSAMHLLPVEVTADDRLIVLSTCTEDITNGRFILVGRLKDKPYKEPAKDKKRSLGLGLGNSTGFWSLLPMWKWAILMAILLLMLIYALTLIADRHSERKLGREGYRIYENEKDRQEDDIDQERKTE